jgi:archaellum component FlaC
MNTEKEIQKINDTVNRLEADLKDMKTAANELEQGQKTISELLKKVLEKC